MDFVIRDFLRKILDMGSLLAPQHVLWKVLVPDSDRMTPPGRAQWSLLSIAGTHPKNHMSSKNRINSSVAHEYAPQ